eukprot:15142095-Alexandrium_andersonii.AAC.1
MHSTHSHTSVHICKWPCPNPTPVGHVEHTSGTLQSNCVLPGHPVRKWHHAVQKPLPKRVLIRRPMSSPPTPPWPTTASMWTG